MFITTMIIIIIIIIIKDIPTLGTLGLPFPHMIATAFLDPLPHYLMQAG
jgi:hypothetical protein